MVDDAEQMNSALPFHLKGTNSRGWTIANMSTAITHKE